MGLLAYALRYAILHRDLLMHLIHMWIPGTSWDLGPSLCLVVVGKVEAFGSDTMIRNTKGTVVPRCRTLTSIPVLRGTQAMAGCDMKLEDIQSMTNHLLTSSAGFLRITFLREAQAKLFSRPFAKDVDTLELKTRPPIPSYVSKEISPCMKESKDSPYLL